MKYFIITIGCQMNKADSERIAGYLEKYGYRPAKNELQADLVVVTTCGVRQSAEDRVYGLIPRIKKENPRAKIILTGCLSLREDVQKRLKNYVDIWLPITELSGLIKKLRVMRSALRKNDYLNIVPKYNSKITAFVPIGNGCNNFCTYCVVPYARGREVYRPAGEIIKEVKNLVKNGYKEIILIAQNVNSYVSKPKIVYFPELLKAVNDIPGDFWVRFATSHPKDMSGELIKTISKCDKVCRHIHLPAQAGDNEILRRMNRKYSIEHYLELIKKIKKSMPDASITTDIIVGFPGETKKQFNNTAKLFKKVKFDMAYIAQYSPRPGTVSAKMEDNVLRAEKKRREEELMKILRQTALENNKKYIGKVVEILIEGKNKKGELWGKTRTEKMVKVESRKGKENLIGKFIKVKINNVKDFGLEGELVN
ncbi:MAG: tRNA (N6-isopentenyl adenosine(37)-C2)-methylthiotransferase MiaB [Patescibacteria group bacterium]|nr:tRNA (N6-isopentenyl adenosine(37)-C2)-methylthiotransferase MiaB [Patescibacteria group bacterium]MDD4610414.1 tRNA (N6-isopentenyl adenosine(37)-C2)-methylthiotransferase MiaB [Patescibacteria group bacterium]